MLQQKSKMNRRDFLKLMGAFAGASAVVTACAPEQIPGPDPTRVVEPPINPTGVPPEPALPPVALGIIALNRMAYGARLDDFDAFNALGATDDERLRNYVAQQLN
ncbi:MAG TPA: twin-arginine translocation signal domain-containing protein, partial [Anaerolineales bacterium]|nr:twin-arginine translocation signal domain-containing protein [Anaerolineales bacterium]